MTPQAWRATLAATCLMALAMGSRSALGLFLSPLNTATGIGVATISLAMAIAQLALGLAQPVVAALAERRGAAQVMQAGALLLAIATVWLTKVSAAWTLNAAMVLAALACSAMGSNAMLVGEISRRVPEARRGLAAGLVGAGGSAGQLLLAPATQWVILGFGWQQALWATAALMLLALPLARAFAAPAAVTRESTPAAAPPVVLSAVLRDRRFALVSLGFAMCGFHVAFLTTHMPGVLELCGLPGTLAGTWLAVTGGANIVGSIGIGLLMRRWSSPLLLALLYGARAVAIAAMLLADPSAPVMLAFAFAMGLTYLAPLAPTTQLLGQYFGVQRLGTLMGVVMVAHQISGFAGAWLGGRAVEHSGTYQGLWLADIGLALLAVALQWPLRTKASPQARPVAPRPASAPMANRSQPAGTYM